MPGKKDHQSRHNCQGAASMEWTGRMEVGVNQPKSHHYRNNDNDDASHHRSRRKHVA